LKLGVAATGVSPSNIKKAVDFALEQRRLGRAVLVHCAHGHGRSAGVILACMIVAGEIDTIDEGAQLLSTLTHNIIASD
jgi:protein-tyrosine phosphatase